MPFGVMGVKKRVLDPGRPPEHEREDRDRVFDRSEP